MIESMTGFGRGAAQVGQTTVAVEMRSVNNRFCEVSLRLPKALAEHEHDISAAVKQALGRGRIAVQVQIEQAAAESLPVQVNEEAARRYAALLEALRRAAGIAAPVGLEHLLAFPDVFTAADDGAAAREEAWAAAQTAMAEAIEGIRSMRRQEGAALSADLQARLEAIAAVLAQIEARAPLRVEEARRRLHTRLQETLADERINPERLELEIALLADRLDITEECVRLHAHLDVFREALAGSEAVGRKLNFLLQEINREVNTIGSKANDAEVAHLAVEMKEEVERIREQVQNLE